MSRDGRRLRLPKALATTAIGVVIAVAAAAGCGDDSMGAFQCRVDPGMDGGPGFDPTDCDVRVSNPDDCPVGCSTAVA